MYEGLCFTLLKNNSVIHSEIFKIVSFRSSKPYSVANIVGKDAGAPFSRIQFTQARGHAGKY